MEKPKDPSFAWKLFLWLTALFMSISVLAFSLLARKPAVVEALGEVRYIILVILGALAGSLLASLQDYLNGTRQKNEDTSLPTNTATPDKAPISDETTDNPYLKTLEPEKKTTPSTEPSFWQLFSKLFRSSEKGFFRQDRRRLTFEIQVINNRATFNLIIGAGISLVSVGYLFLVEKLPIKADTGIPAVLGHYIPRISIVILLQTLAYFFFRLYKSSLTQVAYYQSELTRLSVNEVAVKSAIHTEDKNILFKTIHAIIQSQPSHPHPWAVAQNPELDSETVRKLLELVPKA